MLKIHSPKSTQYAINVQKLQEKADTGPPSPSRMIKHVLPHYPGNITLSTYDEAYYHSLESNELKAAFLRCLASGIENPDSGMGCRDMQDSKHHYCDRNALMSCCLPY